ncbi:MAG: dUTP diphosphatase [Bacillota bacterium]|nr:dUTP diphosphatase [Bacillota bacterium]MDD3297283.1 dUTP diphosphatase [Bacillota bacterium]MDD3850453.1 dUTP diphosphatase [Bacillota bacterium]MDD4706799.1 dUTP diphosphatase [Bacillota bacterium]
MIRVRIKRDQKHTDLPMPEYMSKGSAGMDLHAAVDGSVSIKPGCFELIPTGIYLQLPTGYEAQIRPRSGLAAKKGVTVLNTPGTIDSDYRGEIRVILINLGKVPFVIKRGDRIAQMVVCRYERVELVASQNLDESDRGTGGFGHTGI